MAPQLSPSLLVNFSERLRNSSTQRFILKSSFRDGERLEMLPKKF